MPARNKTKTNGVGQILMVLALAASFTVAAAQDAPRKSVVYFPFGLGSEVLATQGYRLEDELTNAVRAQLAADQRLQIITFSRTHPSVRRGLAEGTLRSALLLEPFTGQSQGQYKAITLGRLFRGDLAMAGVVERFEYDQTKGEANLVVSIELFDLDEVKLAGAIALSATGSGENEHEAVKDAVSKLAAQAAPQAVAIFTAPKKDDGNRK